MNKTDVMEKIYLEYREKVFRYVRGKVRNLADAEDVTSEIFWRVQTALDSYNEEKATLSTWIYSENEILKENLAIALETLSEREQDIIVLYYYHEIPLRDIAIKMGITYTNAKFIKHQAIGKLKLAMKNS